MSRPDTWKSEAACRGRGPDLFFPSWGAEGGGGRPLPAHVVAQVEQAKAICAGCPVRAECLEGAVERGERHGIWGGRLFTGRSAEKLRRARQEAAA